MGKSKDKKAKRERASGEAPQVYAVQKDLTGWHFNRRDFLAAASAVAAAAVVGKSTACTPAPRAEATVTLVPTQDAPTPMSTETGPSGRTPTPTPVIHKVQRGDTLAKIAKQYDVTVEALKAANSLDSDLILVGQELIVPVVDQPTPAAAPKTDKPVTSLAQFIEDVTIPDGTVMEPGQAFTKTWRLKNVGAAEWGEGSNLSFYDGEQMDGASPVAVPNVGPGETVDISVDMMAPAEVGNYTGRWRLYAASGGRLMTLSVVIVVASTEEIPAGEEGVKIEVTEPDGTTRTWTLPCGSPIPPGAVCVCNCVAGGVPSCTCVGHTVTVHYWYPC
jgi:LysM repeat protein